MTHAAIENGNAAAFFDVDGTIIDTTIVHYLIEFQRLRLSRRRFRLWYPRIMAKCGAYLLLDRVNRGLLNKLFYRNYRGMPVAEIKGLARACVGAVARGKWLSGARETIENHRRAGLEIVLVTGSLDFLMSALLADLGPAHILAAELEERGGKFTGELVGGPVIAGEKRKRMTALSAQRGIDLQRCHAYGDASADLPMLEAAGFPHAVNPDRRLKALARRRNWPIHHWPVESQSQR